MKKIPWFDRFSHGSYPLKKAYIDTEPPLDTSKPVGPIQTTDADQMGDLLLFVPRNEIGRMIDDLTGRYGYSHLAIDCGESDGGTGRRVMIEATMGAGVHYGFLDEYGERAFVRIPLWKIGINVQQFCECIHAKIGEKFDDLEAITLGILDNPARQICSDLATVCLPAQVLGEIERCHQKALLHPFSVVRDERRGNGFRLFISPNGFAEFLGAPRGNQLKGPDYLAEPRIPNPGNTSLFPMFRQWNYVLAANLRKYLPHR